MAEITAGSAVRQQRLVAARRSDLAVEGRREQRQRRRRHADDPGLGEARRRHRPELPADAHPDGPRSVACAAARRIAYLLDAGAGGFLVDHDRQQLDRHQRHGRDRGDDRTGATGPVRRQPAHGAADGARAAAPERGARPDVRRRGRGGGGEGTGGAAAREADDDDSRRPPRRLHAARDVARPGDRIHHPRRGLRVPQPADRGSARSAAT